jgi:CxxC-x17-CxxC domain-containing protein
MYEGNWKCSNCGGAITQLPFQPRSETGLTCRDCWMKAKDAEKGAAPAAAPEMGGSSSGPMDDQDVPDFTEHDLGGGSAGPQDDDGLGGTPVTPGEKPKFEGDWQCAGCGASITSLPFQPRDTSNLKCIDCFKASRA